jgi:hypothetical protein
VLEESRLARRCRNGCVLCSRATRLFQHEASGDEELPLRGVAHARAAKTTTSPNPLFCRHTNGDSKITAAPLQCDAQSLRKAFDPQVAHCDPPVSPAVRHPLSKPPFRTFIRSRSHSTVVMTSATEDVSPPPRDARPSNNGGLGTREKERSKGENVAGWSFMMRPLRRKGLKGSETTTATRPDTNVSKEDTGSKNGQTDLDLETTQTKGSGYGVGHTEALREVTSQDGLLEESGEHGRATGAGPDNRGAPQDNDASVERTLRTGGGEFKVYKRRWFGVVQLVLLNTIVSWDVSVCVFPATGRCSIPSRLITNNCCSGSLSPPTQLPSLSIMVFLSRPSTGSAPLSSLPSSSCLRLSS